MRWLFVQGAARCSAGNDSPANAPATAALLSPLRHQLDAGAPECATCSAPPRCPCSELARPCSRAAERQHRRLPASPHAQPRPSCARRRRARTQAAARRWAAAQGCGKACTPPTTGSAAASARGQAIPAWHLVTRQHGRSERAAVPLHCEVLGPQETSQAYARPERGCTRPSSEADAGQGAPLTQRRSPQPGAPAAGTRYMNSAMSAMWSDDQCSLGRPECLPRCTCAAPQKPCSEPIMGHAWFLSSQQQRAGGRLAQHDIRDAIS